MSDSWHLCHSTVAMALHWEAVLAPDFIPTFRVYLFWGEGHSADLSANSRSPFLEQHGMARHAITQIGQQK